MELIYYEACLNEKDAFRREKYLKTTYGRRYLRNRLKEYFTGWTEGKGRQYKREFIQFLHIAQGSLFEVVTLNQIFMIRKLFSEEDANEIRKRCEQIDRKLNGLINSLRGTRGQAKSSVR